MCSREIEAQDVIVVGGGVSGVAFAWKAAGAGRKVLLLERGERVGGCLNSHRRENGFWFEMGAHTTYNSYGRFLEIAQGSGAVDRLVARGPARARFGLLRDGSCSWLSPPKLLARFNWLGVLTSFPLGILRGKKGRTMASYYGGLVGRGNYERLLGPFLAAVPSQSADGFPAAGPGSLFKKRPRREEYPRSFGFEGGLQTVCDAASRIPGLKVRMGVEVARVASAGSSFRLETAGGETFEAETVAVAAPVHAAAAMLRRDFGELSAELDRVGTVEVESLGAVLSRERCWMPEIAFLVPADDIFWSAVTRDPFPDPRFRAFAFHFKPGHSREEKLRRMADILRVDTADLGDLAEQRIRIPSPALGHGAIVASLDRRLAGGRLALTGNYFQGLAIEDCVQRSFEEWARVGRGAR